MQTKSLTILEHHFLVVLIFPIKWKIKIENILMGRAKSSLIHNNFQVVPKKLDKNLNKHLNAQNLNKHLNTQNMPL